MLCERTTSAKTVLMKWWPSESRKAKLNATKDLANMFQTVITSRRKSGKKEEDALQVLLDEGCTDNDILQFILTTLFAGQSLFPFAFSVIPILTFVPSKLRYHVRLDAHVPAYQPRMEG